MAQALERHEQAGSGDVHRRGVTLGRREWTLLEEPKVRGDLWDALSTPAMCRRGVARDFAEAVRSKAGVGEIWVTDVHQDLCVAVAFEDPTLEIEVRGVFLNFVCEKLDPSEGELFAFPDGEVPDWVRRGEQLV
jgi:hypothetical protein